MLIYSTYAGASCDPEIIRLGMGYCVTPNRLPNRGPDMPGVPYFMDNGAFSCWIKGYPYMPDLFWKTLAGCFQARLDLDFIVVPDLVADAASLDYSIKWLREYLPGGDRYALAVQDGMTPKDVKNDCRTNFHRLKYIFIGGSVDWKWKTAAEWVSFARDEGKRVHIGQVGSLRRLRAAQSLGVDSVDSGSFTRNKSWSIVEEFQGKSPAPELWSDAI